MQGRPNAKGLLGRSTRAPGVGGSPSGTTPNGARSSPGRQDDPAAGRAGGADADGEDDGRVPPPRERHAVGAGRDVPGVERPDRVGGPRPAGSLDPRPDPDAREGVPGGDREPGDAAGPREAGHG